MHCSNRGRIHWLAVLIAVFLAMTRAARAQDVDPLDDLPALPHAPGTITDQTDPRWGKPRIADVTSSPISPEELRDFALILRLSVEQQAVLRAAYLDYRQRTDQLYKRHGPEIASNAYAAADSSANPYDKEYLGHLTAMREAEGRF